MLSIGMKGNSPLGFTSEVITLLLTNIISIHSYSIMRKEYAQNEDESLQPSRLHLGSNCIITCKYD